MLIHLPREHGYGLIPRTKNGPALAGYGALTMAGALAQTITTLPEELRRSLTWDRGKELSAHAQFSIASGVEVYFADPKSPWQRGTNEKHQRPITPILSKGHRPIPLERRRNRSHRPYSQHPTTQNPRLAHSRRGVQRPPTLATASRCCDHRLNPACEPRSVCMTQPATSPRRATAL